MGRFLDMNYNRGMDHSHLEQSLATHGWRYDAERERFTDGLGPIDHHQILALMPGVSIEDLVSFVDEKRQKWLAKRS